MVRPSKNVPRALEKDWFAEPGEDPLAKINRIFSCTESRDDGKEIPKDIPIPNMSKVFAYDHKTKAWTHLGYRCFDCGKPLREGRVTEKHPLICKKTLKINKEDTKGNDMPIQRVTKNGETYYRWGTHGKLYKDRKDAEKQAQAAHASGYKEPIKKKD